MKKQILTLLQHIHQDGSLTWYEKQNRINLVKRLVAIYNCYNGELVVD